MFVRDSAIGRINDLGNPGYECNAMTTGTDGLIYIGGGTRNATQDECTAIGYANFAVYDPTKSWNPGQGSHANPRDLGQAVSFNGNVVGYPIVVHDLVTAPDGKIYGCTGFRDGIEDEYYAHLFVFDPQTGEIKDLGQPIPDYSSITRLAVMPDGTLYGITLPPRTGPDLPPGELFSYDPVSTFTLLDMPSNMSGAIALATGKDGLLYIAGGAEDRDIFAYDPVSRTFEYKGSLKEDNSILRLICSRYGIIYIGCGENGYLVRYDPERLWEGQSDDSIYKSEANPRLFQWTGKVSALTDGPRGVMYCGTLSGSLFSFKGQELSEHSETHYMHIASIEMCLYNHVGHIGAVARIMLVDENEDPVQGARILVNWRGLTNRDDQEDFTDNNGLATILSPSVSPNLYGEFCFEVADITRYSDWIYTYWVYSPEENVESGACIHTSAQINGFCIN